jgi:hypothetical protein
MSSDPEPRVAALERAAQHLDAQNELLEQLVERLHDTLGLEEPQPSLTLVKGDRDT